MTGSAGDLLASPGLPPVLAALPGARLVGGCVRDALAERPVADIDLATPDPPEQVMQALAAAGVKAVPTGIAHGTVTAVSEGRPFEITTLRRDTAPDGRHTQVAWTEDWQEDAARRDFTINAMSLDRAGQLHDYFGGRDDLAAGRVRFVGEARRRVEEDYLRILRFFRFLARYGRGAPDAEAMAAIRDGVAGLARLSAERVWSELKRILAVPDPRPAMALMAESGVLAAVLPEGADAARLGTLVAAGLPPDPLLRLAALVPAAGAALALRLRLSNAEAEALECWQPGTVPAPTDDAAALRRALADAPAPVLAARSWLRGGTGPDWDALRARLAAMPRPVFPLEGRDALALGARPGPAVGAALRAVRAWWMAGGCVADAASCRQELRKVLTV